MEIEKLRKQIDKIDDDILELLSRRNDIVKRIAEVKKSLDFPIFDEKREGHLIERLKKKAKEYGLDDDYIIELYNLILHNSKKVQ